MTAWSLCMKYKSQDFYRASAHWRPCVCQIDVQLNSTMRLISGTLRSTPLPWLPVLSNVEPPSLRRKAATDKLVEKIVKHDSWPILPDILSPPLLRLTSRKPLWLNLQPVDIKSRWRHNWKSAQVVNSHLVCDPTIRQPGFDLPRQQWSLLNRFRTDQGHCGACRRKWRLTDTDLCPLVRPRWCPTLSNPVPMTKLNGGLSRLHSADEDAVSWMTRYGSWHAYEKKEEEAASSGVMQSAGLSYFLSRDTSSSYSFSAFKVLQTFLVPFSSTNKLPDTCELYCRWQDVLFCL